MVDAKEYEFVSGPIGLSLVDDAVTGKVVITKVAPGSQAAAHRVPLHGAIIGINGRRGRCSKQEILDAVQSGARPLALEVERPGAPARSRIPKLTLLSLVIAIACAMYQRAMLRPADQAVRKLKPVKKSPLKVPKVHYADEQEERADLIEQLEKRGFKLDVLGVEGMALETLRTLAAGAEQTADGSSGATYRDEEHGIETTISEPISIDSFKGGNIKIPGMDASSRGGRPTPKRSQKKRKRKKQ
jgi:hypothetical protein